MLATNLIKKIIEHPKTYCKLSKTIKQVEKFSQVGPDKSSHSPLYSETKNSETFLDAKITKRSHAYTGYGKTYSVEILNSFNPERQLKILNLQLKIS